MVDFEELNAKLLAQVPDLLYKWLPDGKMEGRYFSALNPMRGDTKTGSFKVDTSNGIWKDYSSSDAGGDLISLYAYLNSMKQSEAAKELGATAKESKGKAKLVEVKEEILFPVTKDINFAVPYHPTYPQGHDHGPYIYRDITGNIFGGVVFYKKPDGSKDPRPIVYSKTKSDWVFKGFPDPRPLYKLDVFQDARQIIIVEGEKCADMAQRMLPMAILTTWQGGAQAVDKSNWKPLFADVPVAIWRDNDEPGEKAEERICKILAGKVKRLMILKKDCLKDKPKGWDVADAINEGWSQEKIKEFLSANLVPYIPDMPRGGAQQGDLPPQAGINTAPLNKYFKELGMTGNNNYGFYNFTSGMIHTADIKLCYDKKFLISLTGSNPYYWTVQSEKDGDGIAKPDWAAFACQLTAKCQNLGMFNYAKVRGLGMWEDKGNFIVNAGKDFYVNNEKVHLYDYDSKWIYAARDGVKLNATQPLTLAEMRKYRDMTMKIRWSTQENAMLFFGWMVAAPAGGILPWRSHIYLQGSAGSGKSWICSYLRRFFGNFQYGFTMATTAPGMRRKNNNGSVPIIFDEAELDESQSSMTNLQEILKLARISSRNDGMTISMAKSGGGTDEFTMQNCFCFASIIPSITQYADETRTTVLSIKEKRNETDEDIARFKELKKEYMDLPEDISERYVAWCILNSKKILQNFNTFFEAAAILFMSDRFAEQMAMMLAGYYAVDFDDPVTEDQAGEILAGYNWRKLLPSSEMTAEVKLLDSITSAKVDMEVMEQSYRKSITRSIKEIVAAYCYLKHKSDFPDPEILLDVMHPGDSNLIREDQAEHVLSNYGIKYDSKNRAVAIAVSGKTMSNLLRGSVWVNKWSTTLQNIVGSFNYPSAIYFRTGTKRAMGIPVTIFLDCSPREEES